MKLMRHQIKTRHKNNVKKLYFLSLTISTVLQKKNHLTRMMKANRVNYYIDYNVKLTVEKYKQKHTNIQNA